MQLRFPRIARLVVRSHGTVGFVRLRAALPLLSFGLAAFLVACAAGTGVRQPDDSSAAMEGYRHVEDLYIVDCLLPGQVRQMGKMTYLTPRRPIKTNAQDCRIRGGEYVAYDRADYKSALRVWQGRAEEGDAEAQVMVGEIYEKGLGTAPDYARAAEWYRKAADQGNERALTNLAYLYEQGLGVEQDMTTAINLYRKAAGDSGDELMLASAAREKYEKMRAELEQELGEARAQKRALARQIEDLKGRLGQQQAQRQEDRETIAALENLLADTNERLEQKSQRLNQLASMDLPRSDAGGADESQTASDTADVTDTTETLAQREEALDRREKELARREESLARQVEETRQELQARRQALAQEEARVREELKAERRALAEQEARVRRELEAERQAVVREEAESEEALEARRRALAEREAKLEQEIEAQRKALASRETQAEQALNSRRETLAQQEAQLRAQAQARDDARARRAAMEQELAQAREEARALEDDLARREAALDQREKMLAQREQALAARESAESEVMADAGGEATGPEPESDLTEGMEFGRYFALVIGLQDYRYWDELRSARRDADRVAEVLQQRYGFVTKVLHDAGAMEILTALNELRTASTEYDNVLIYFAGRGQLRQPVEDAWVGYWLPVDAQREQNMLWLPNSQINEQIAMLKARSVLVVADSCFAGAMSTDPASLLVGGRAELTERRIKLGLERRARYTLSSGGLHPVPDPRQGKHSIFASAMIEVLTQNDGLLSEQQLIQQITERVTQSAKESGIEQRPELKPNRAAGHVPGGSFYMVPRQAQTTGIVSNQGTSAAD